MQSQALHMMILYLFILSINICTAQVVPRMAKYDCEEYCGDVLIPYPFGIGSNKDCYLDNWFEIECSNQSSKTSSSAPHYKPVLKQAKLEVLNISIGDPLQGFGGTLQVNSPVTFFCNETGSSPMANLTGSPFVYSQDKNRFTAVSCGFFAGMESAEFVVACKSVCDHKNYNASCDIGINCCQTTIPPYLRMMSASILYQGETRNADCDDYAFLVDKDWFESERSSSAHAVKSRSHVPVLLEWNIINSTSSLALFEGYVTNDSKPYKNSYYNYSAEPRCYIYTLDSKNRSAIAHQQSLRRVYCECPEGSVGNPYLLETCQGTYVINYI
ncbi:unnamed protein product [Prunus armeniaca]